MRTHPHPDLPKSAHPFTPREPVALYRTFGWAFLPPAVASSTYGLLDVFAGLAPSTAAFFSVLLTLILLFSPGRSLMDWSGLCFASAAVGFIAVGNPFTILLGGISAVFAVLTAFDEESGLNPARKAVLLGIYWFSAGLTLAAHLIPVWTTLGLALLYLLMYMTVRLLPLGLTARASLMDEDS